MYRVGASRLKGLKGSKRSLVASRLLTSGAVACESSSGQGPYTWLTREHSSSLPLESVNVPPVLPDHVEMSKTKITTLANGVTFASEMSLSPAGSIGLYVDSGSIYESPLNFSASSLLERMAFTSTANRNHLCIVRETEAIGGNVGASASREQMAYTFDALKTYVPQMVELLIDCVRNPVFLDWEVNEELQKLKADLGELSKNPQGLLLEAIHSAGYSGALAYPLLVPESSLDRLNGSILEEFFHENYTAPIIVIAASGLQHEELLSVADPLLSDLPGVPLPDEPESVYVGGDYCCQGDSNSTHIAVTFETPGGRRNEKASVTSTVLKLLMGGGGSFSAGGPGKGMLSRLYRRVLNKHHRIESFSAFNSI